MTEGDADPAPPDPLPTARYFRRVLAREVAGYEATGWVRVAADWSDSVGELALMQWNAAGAPPGMESP